MKLNTLIGQLRFTAIAEGISYLLLLFVGMPLKYMLNMPLPNYIIGMAHGVLFVAYVGLVLAVAWRYKWDWLKTLIALAASLFPFATFWVEWKWLRGKS
mgnify:CR=1 FL=1